MSSDESGRFGDALEEADCHYVSRVVDSGSEHGECAPDEHHAWEENAGFEVVEGEV